MQARLRLKKEFDLAVGERDVLGTQVRRGGGVVGGSLHWLCTAPKLPDAGWGMHAEGRPQGVFFLARQPGVVQCLLPS